MSRKENKREWMKSGVGCVFWRRWKVVRITPFPSCSSFTCLCCPLVDRSQSWQHFKPCTKRHVTRWSLLYSSNFKIYWDWLVFANNSQANSSTKHEVRKRLQWPQHQNRRLMVGCKNVFVIITINREKKNICTRALKSAKKQNRCKNRTDIFFFDYFTHFVTNTGLWSSSI